MDVTQELRQDHTALRQQLDLLEEALTAVHRPELIRGGCCVLAKMLEAHVGREKRMIARYVRRIHPLRQRSNGYETERVVLEDLNKLFAEGVKLPVSAVAIELFRLIDDLREHMALEERELFPMIERAEDGQRSSPRGETSVASVAANCGGDDERH